MNYQGVIESSEETKIFDKQSDEVYELGGMEEVEDKPTDIDITVEDNVEPIVDIPDQQEPPDISSEDQSAS